MDYVAEKGALEITYSLYQTYLNEIKELEDTTKAAEDEQLRITDSLRVARVLYLSLDKSLFTRLSSAENVSKQLYQETDAMDYMENNFQEELKALRTDNEDVTLVKHRVTTRINNAKSEAEGLKIMSHNIEAKLLEVQEEIEKLKAAKIAYEESTMHEKEQLKQRVQGLAEKNKEFSKAVDSITSEIAAKSKTQKHLELTLTKTKDELRSLIKLFAKKQEREEAQANDRKASLYEEVIAGGAPTGEVTLIFSSVDGSKELWEMFPMAMTLAIDIHNNTVKNRIKSTGGYEVKSDGDSFMVAFSDVFSGLQYCMLVQEDLLGATWPQEIFSSPYAAEKQSADGRLLFSGLRCRMGIHVGKPQCRPNPVTGRMDYLGSMVNKSARVAGLAHGGQVFVSDTALKHLFDIKDENCQVYMSQLGIRCVGTFQLRGIPGEEKITEILPRTLKDRQFAPVGVDFPQSPTAAVPKDVPANQPTTTVNEIPAEAVPEHETPGAQFAKFAEIHEPLPHVPNASLHPSSAAQKSLQNTSHLSVSIPSPTSSPIPSPSYGTPIIESMESLTNSLLSSMSMKSVPSVVGESMAEQQQQEQSESTENGTKKFPFTPSPIISHPDDVILQKHEEKLKDAEDKLIRLKSDLARVKTEKDEVRDKLKTLKDSERMLKFRESQDRQQDLAKVAFEKLHTTQLLEQAQSNITGIKSVLKSLEEKIVQTTASRDHAKNAYQYWDRMMKLCTPEVLTYAKKSTQLETDWAALRSGKLAYFNAAKNLEINIEKTANSVNSIAAAPINGEEELVIEQMLELREAESDLLMFEVLHKDKQAEVNSYLMRYLQQLQTAIADETPTRSLLTTKELAEKTAQQEQQLQRLHSEKQRYLTDIQEAQKSMAVELSQQQKTIKQSHSEISAEVQRTRELKTKFGGAIADKYQEVVQHVQLLEQTQKLIKTKEKRGSLSPVGDKTIDRRALFASMDNRGREASIGKASAYHSTINLLDSGPAKKESRAGNRSPTERDTPVSVRAAKGYSSSYTLLEKKRERADSRVSRGSRREDLSKGEESRDVVRDSGGMAPEKGDRKEIGDPANPESNKEFAVNESGTTQPQLDGETTATSAQPRQYQPQPQAEFQSGAQALPSSVQGSHVGPQASRLGVQIGTSSGTASVSPHSPTSPSALQGPLGLHLKSYAGLYSDTLNSSSSSPTSSQDRSPTVNSSVVQGSGRIGTSGKVVGGQIGKLQAARAMASSGGQGHTMASESAHTNSNRADGAYDFRSIALVQNELAARLAANRHLPSDLDATRDQMAALSRLSKGTKSEEADLSVVGVGTGGDGYALPIEDKQQRMSFSLLRLAMQIRPEVYYRKRGGAARSMEDLKVAGQKLLS